MQLDSSSQLYRTHIRIPRIKQHFSGVFGQHTRLRHSAQQSGENRASCAGRNPFVISMAKVGSEFLHHGWNFTAVYRNGGVRRSPGRQKDCERHGRFSCFGLMNEAQQPPSKANVFALELEVTSPDNRWGSHVERKMSLSRAAVVGSRKQSQLAYRSTQGYK